MKFCASEFSTGSADGSSRKRGEANAESSPQVAFPIELRIRFKSDSFQPMPEMGNVAEMAKQVADEIFSVFGWEGGGPADQDWECVSPQKHAVKTHPSDVVMHYEDPYSPFRLYFNFDLKSYGASSISKHALLKAIRTLAMATDCANVSPAWANLYAGQEGNRKTSGVLFVYNHDGEYEDDFDSIISSIDSEKIQLNRGNRLFIIGPRRISYLATVANDILRCRGLDKQAIAPAERCSFYYPDLVSARPKSNSQKAASIEMILGPWQILRFPRIDGQNVTDCHYLYYAGAGSTIDEFKYLLDSLFRYQRLDENAAISLRMPFADENASATFRKAKEAYAEDFYNLKEFRERLEKVTFDPISRIIREFSRVQLGMENG